MEVNDHTFHLHLAFHVEDNSQFEKNSKLNAHTYTHTPLNISTEAVQVNLGQGHKQLVPPGTKTSGITIWHLGV